jgi:hypothetical protein
VELHHQLFYLLYRIGLRGNTGDDDLKVLKGTTENRLHFFVWAKIKKVPNCFCFLCLRSHIQSTLFAVDND